MVLSTAKGAPLRLRSEHKRTMNPPSPCNLLSIGSLDGQSPRPRGNRPGVHCGVRCRRSIPAPAGEPIAVHELSHAWEVYPRPCGGNSVDEEREGFLLGLSPPMRGKQLDALNSQLLGRSIPAHAGETARHGTASSSLSVYPRPCGGNSRFARSAARLAGLSPPMRGKRLYVCACNAIRRSIPAHAGETVALSGSGGGRSVYPRPCGGNMLPFSRSFSLSGLSPPMRGKHLHAYRASLPIRSIPAHAGETSRQDG